MFTVECITPSGVVGTVDLVLGFGVTAITIAWVSTFLRLGDRARAGLVGAFTLACVVETALVSLQAWRGVPSHFNVETAADVMVVRFLTAGGFTLVVVIVALTIAAFRANPAVPASMRLAIRIGLGALVAAQITGGLMIARGMGLVFAGHPQAAYATAGALKPTHAVTMPGIQLLPVMAWLLSFTDWSEERRTNAVLAIAAGYLLLAGAIVVSNVLGLSPQAP